MPVLETPIYTAFAANLLIAAAWLTAAAFTGSSAMAAAGIHSLVDTSNEVLPRLKIFRTISSSN